MDRNHSMSYRTSSSLGPLPIWYISLSTLVAGESGERMAKFGNASSPAWFGFFFIRFFSVGNFPSPLLSVARFVFPLAAHWLIVFHVGETHRRGRKILFVHLSVERVIDFS